MPARPGASGAAGPAGSRKKQPALANRGGFEGYLARHRDRMTYADGRRQSSLSEPCGAMTDGYRPKRYGLK